MNETIYIVTKELSDWANRTEWWTIVGVYKTESEAKAAALQAMQDDESTPENVTDSEDFADHGNYFRFSMDQEKLYTSVLTEEINPNEGGE